MESSRVGKPFANIPITALPNEQVLRPGQKKVTLSIYHIIYLYNRILICESMVYVTSCREISKEMNGQLTVEQIADKDGGK